MVQGPGSIIDSVMDIKFPLALQALKPHNSRRMSHHSDDLIMLFNDLFRESHRTILVKGGVEPEYCPATGPDGFARIVFAYDYFASALHEVSHWCIAGQHRRTLPDYGYWYCPDGRNVEQQQAFESVEIKPQALEWLFSVAAGTRFHISVDNISGAGAIDEAVFREQVRRQANIYLRTEIPRRAGLFQQTLLAFYGRQAKFLEDWNSQGEPVETRR